MVLHCSTANLFIADILMEKVENAIFWDSCFEKSISASAFPLIYQTGHNILRKKFYYSKQNRTTISLFRSGKVIVLSF